jgi:hypothetical protein
MDKSSPDYMSRYPNGKLMMGSFLARAVTAQNQIAQIVFHPLLSQRMILFSLDISGPSLNLPPASELLVPDTIKFIETGGEGVGVDRKRYIYGLSNGERKPRLLVDIGSRMVDLPIAVDSGIIISSGNPEVSLIRDANGEQKLLVIDYRTRKAQVHLIDPPLNRLNLDTIKNIYPIEQNEDTIKITVRGEDWNDNETFIIEQSEQGYRASSVST